MPNRIYATVEAEVQVDLDDLIPLEREDIQYLADESGWDIVFVSDEQSQPSFGERLSNAITERHDKWHWGSLLTCADSICDAFSGGWLR